MAPLISSHLSSRRHHARRSLKLPELSDALKAEVPPLDLLLIPWPRSMPRLLLGFRLKHIVQRETRSMVLRFLIDESSSAHLV